MANFAIDSLIFIGVPFIFGCILASLISYEVFKRKLQNATRKLAKDADAQHSVVTKRLISENRELSLSGKDLKAATCKNPTLFSEWIMQEITRESNSKNSLEKEYIAGKIDLVTRSHSSLIENDLNDSFCAIIAHLNNHEKATSAFSLVKHSPAILELKKNPDINDFLDKMVASEGDQNKIEDFFDTIKHEIIAEIMRSVDKTDPDTNAFTSQLFTAHANYIEAGKNDFSRYHQAFKAAVDFNGQLTSFYTKTKRSFSIYNINVEKYHR